MNKNLVDKQHRKGKLFVEERLQLLFDNHQYTELTTPEDRDGVYVCEARSPASGWWSRPRISPTRAARWG